MREVAGCVRQLLEGDVECEPSDAEQPFTSSLVFALILIQDNGRKFIPQGIWQSVPAEIHGMLLTSPSFLVWF